MASRVGWPKHNKEPLIETPAELVAAITEFLAYVDQVSVDYFSRMNYVHTKPPKHEADYMSVKWCRIIVMEERNGNYESSSVYAFVCLQDYSTKTLGTLKAGDIHKAATFKAPAKHARGKILDKNTWTCAGPHSIAYLK